MLREPITALFERLADLQIRRPGILVAVVVAMSAVATWLALHLELRTRFDQLLPDDQPSVAALHALEARTTTAQTAMLVVEGDDPNALGRFGDAIVAHLVALGPDVVASAEDGVQSASAFLQPRAGLFLEPAEIDQLATDFELRWSWEVSRAMGTALDTDAPPPVDRAEIERLFANKAGERRVAHFPGARYVSSDGKALVVVARSRVPLGDIDGARRAALHMQQAVDAARAEDPAFAHARATWTGDMIAGLEEYGAVRDDLLHVGITGVALVLAVVLVYFMRVRALVVMTITIACGLAVTFGSTELAIGHLNVATGFLFSIVAGNGINVAILYLSRYYEELRGGASVADAIRTAHRATWPSTSAAAVASAAAYVSLAATHFRTFRQFAFIGSFGMLACWLVTVTLLPALLALVDRDARSRSGVAYGKLFAKIVPLAPRAFVALGALVAILGAVCAVRYVKRDPMEYDLAKIQNDRAASAETRRAWDVATSILGHFNDAMIVLADDPAQAHEAAQILQERWDRAPMDAKPFAAVHSIFDFVPKDQAKKIPPLLALASRLREARARNMIGDDDWSRIAPVLPPPDLAPFDAADLPDAIARPFTEKDGRRGALVLVEPSATDSTNDLHYLLRYASSFRDVKLHDGKVVLHGAGRALVFADILDAVVTQVPRALVVSLVLTILAVVVTLGRNAHAASVLGALAVGFAGVAAFLFFAHVRLNFLNFVALPITFGIGVDYAVNVMQRFRENGKDMLSALRTTGGAVVLCSLTTMLGYFALVGSQNQAIRSMGTVAVVGEVSCLLAAVLVLPAFWLVVSSTGSGSGGAASSRRA